MKTKSDTIVAIHSLEVPPRSKPSNYPEPFLSKVQGREKRQLGDFFGLKNFGVNLTRLQPNSQSAIFHAHTKQEEFIFILEGEVILKTDQGETVLSAGMCAGFRPNSTAHCLINKSDNDVVYLEIGDRTPGDDAIYPEDDLKAVFLEAGKWIFTHKDGSPY